MSSPQSLPDGLTRATISQAHRLYDTRENELLIITGWNDTDVVAGETADTAVLIEDCLTDSNTRYVPVTTATLYD